MTLHADALRVLSAWTPTDAGQRVLRERYVAHLDRHPDGCLRSCVPEHLTASLLVLDRSLTRVLLTLHAKSGRWFQLGGHLEPEDQTLDAAALREAVEESGLSHEQLEQRPEPLLLDAHAVSFCGTHGARHLDVMFSALADDDARLAVSTESIDVAWWDVDDLPDPELAPFVDRAVRRHRAVRDQSTSSAS